MTKRNEKHNKKQNKKHSGQELNEEQLKGTVGGVGIAPPSRKIPVVTPVLNPIVPKTFIV